MSLKHQENPSPIPERPFQYEDIGRLRERLLHVSLLIGNVLALLAYIPSVVLLVYNKSWALLALATFLYASSLFLFVRRKLSYKFRAFGTLGVLYLLGLGIIVVRGPFTGGPVWLFLFGVAAAYLLGRSAAITALCLNFLTLVLLGICIHAGLFTWGTVIEKQWMNWAIAVALFVPLNAIAAFSVAFLADGLKISIDKYQKERLELIDAQKRLKGEISNHEEAKRIIAYQEERQRKVLDSVAIGIILIDADKHTIEYINETALTMIGTTATEAVGKTCHDYICPAEKGKCPISDLGGVVDSSERILLVPGKGELPILKTVVPISLREGEFLLESLVDISERKRLEEQLRQAQKMEALGTLAGGIAHDFNNILGGIMGYTDLCLVKARAGKPHHQELDQVLSAVDRAKGLVQQILTFSRRTTTEMTLFSLNKLVCGTVELLERAIPRMIEIQMDLADDPWTVNVDVQQIEQVLMNLCVNAGDAMPDGGVLVIRTENASVSELNCSACGGLFSGDYVKLSVQDYGHGIEEQTMQRIFEPFFTTKEVGKGTGLGLSTVFGVVNDHGGHTLCHSTLGKGTTFEIYLPAMKGAAVAETQDGTTGVIVAGGRETLLMVDDEKYLRDIGQEVLTEMGYRVLLAGTGEEALRIYQEQRGEIDLVILDLNMPGMGGHWCMKHILAEHPEAKILVASGYSSTGNKKETLAAGALGFVAKPFGRFDLLKEVRAALDNGSM